MSQRLSDVSNFISDSSCELLRWDKFWNPAKIVVSYSFLRSWNSHGWAGQTVIVTSQGFWLINIFLKWFLSLLSGDFKNRLDTQAICDNL